MYTGRSQRGLGCADCVNRPGPGLGIAPAVAAVVVQQAPAILASIGKLFGDTGSFSQTHQRILDEVALILSDPVQATSGVYVMRDDALASPANAYLYLRCWAGDQSVLPMYRKVSGDPAPNGCGCETLFGCRRDAQAALAQVDAALNQAAPLVSSAPIPSAGAPSASGGTVYAGLPGGGGVNIPVPVSAITNATVLGVPVSLWLLGGVALAFAGGHRQGRRR